MYERLYHSIPDVPAYLERLQVPAPVKLDKSYLDTLIYAHQCRIPFEKLDVCAYHRPISLGIPDIFDKVIVSRRGGYCFELNALFTQLLKDLGYHATACMCRILRNKAFTPPILHRGIIVESEGRQYFCDVGYGGPAAPGSVLIEDHATTCFGSGQYHVSRTDDYWWTLSRTTSSGLLELVMQFYTMPQENVDFVAMNDYCSQNPNSIFTQKLFLNVRTGDGAAHILGTVFTLEKGADTLTRNITDCSEFLDIAHTYFDLHCLDGFNLPPEDARVR